MESTKFYELVIAGIPYSLDLEYFLAKLKEQYRGILSIHRIVKYPAIPTTLVRVRTTYYSTQQHILQHGIYVNGIKHSTDISRPKFKILRCYKCQELNNHVAKMCPNQDRCVKCSEPHHSKNCQANQMNCANCGQGHRADSSRCPAWEKEYRNHVLSKTSASKKDITELRQLITNNHDEINNRLNQIIQQVVTKLNKAASPIKSRKRKAKRKRSCSITIPCSVDDPNSPSVEIQTFVNQESNIEITDHTNTELFIEPEPTVEIPQPETESSTIEQSQQSEAEIQTSSKDTRPTVGAQHVSPEADKFEYTIPIYYEPDEHEDVTTAETFCCKIPRSRDPQKRKLLKLFSHHLSLNKAVAPLTEISEMDTITVSEFDPHAYEAYMREIMTLNHACLRYRFETGYKTIKIMNERTRTISYEIACSKPHSTIKNESHTNISCCLFHHLSARIKDFINLNKGNIVNNKLSLASWRTICLE